VIVRAETVRAAGRWDPVLVNLADWDLWVRLAREGAPACVAAPLVGYRIHDGNASSNTSLVLQEARALDGRYGTRLDYGELHHYLAWVCLRSGRRRAAVGHLVRAASRGQIRQVTRTALGLAVRRAARQLPRLRLTTPVHDGAWMAEAESWIARLRDFT
jgi:hypothetical protein